MRIAELCARGEIEGIIRLRGMKQFPFLSLPRELRDEIYDYFAPVSPKRCSLSRTACPDSGETDTTMRLLPSNTTNLEELELTREGQSLLLLKKQVHNEYVEALRRLTTWVLYLHMENNPQHPNEFIFDHKALSSVEAMGAVVRLIVLATWHSGEVWDDVQAEKESEHMDIDDGDLFVEDPGTNDKTIIPSDRTPSTLERPNTAQASATLLTTVKAVLANLRYVEELDITLDAGSVIDVYWAENFSSDKPTLVHINSEPGSVSYVQDDFVYHAKDLQMQTLLEWRPAPEDGLERVKHITKTIFRTRDSRHCHRLLPLQIEERRRRDATEEDEGWWNVKNTPPILLEEEHNWGATESDDLQTSLFLA